MNQLEVIQFARRWYAALNDHAPLAEVEAFLDPRGFEMKFPEATLRTKADFRRWYRTVCAKFFDEEHLLKQIDVRPGRDSANVFLVVNWIAHTWESPAAYSQRIDADAYQTWVVSKRGRRLVISQYNVLGMTENTRRNG